MITVNTPDGGTAQFPDDTPQDAILGAMKQKFGGPDSSSGGILNTAANVAKSLSDTITFGTGDALRSVMTGEDYGKLSASSKQAHEDLGLADIPVTMAGYALNPFGMAGVGERIGAGLATRVGGGALKKAASYGTGAAIEGATAQTLGDLGHGEAPGSDVLTSGALAAPFGAAVGGRGRSVIPAVERAAGKPTVGGAVKDLLGPETPPPAARSIGDLQAAKDAAFNTLETTPVSTRTVKGAISNALGNLTPGQQADLSTAMRGQIGDIASAIRNSSGLTLGDAYSFQRSLGSIKYTPGDVVAGAKVGEALRALSPQMKDAALAHGQLADATRLTGQLKDMGWFGTGADAIAAAKKGTAPGAVRAYSPAGRDAMEALANAGPSPLTQAMQHAAAAGINKGLGMVGGHWIGGALGESGIGTLIGAQTGAGAMNIGRALTQARSSAAAKRAMKAALAATSTGQRATADMYRGAPWLAQGARQAVYANAAQGSDQ